MNCSEERELITSLAFLLVLGSQALAGFISAVLSVIVIRKCRCLYFHINCRIIMSSLLLFYIAHSFFIGALQAIQVFRYLVYPYACDVGITPSLCFWLRFPATVCMVCCAALQFAMVVERAVALWKRENYENFSSKLGYTSAVVSFIASVAFTSWALRSDDFTQRTAYCSAATATSAGRVTVLVFSLCGVDVLTLLGILVLFILNGIALKRKIFDLHSSYQLRENIVVIRFILPLTLFQTVFYFLFSASTGIISLFERYVSLITYRTLFAAFYVIPYYTAVAPILIWFIIKWSQQLRQSKLRRLKMRNTDERETYFRTYAHMWNSGHSNKY